MNRGWRIMRAGCMALVLGICLNAPAMATILYDTGPDAMIYPNGDWAINNGLDVCNPFTLAQDSVLTGVTASLRSNPEYPAVALDWYISLAPTYQNLVASGTAQLSPRGTTVNVDPSWLQGYQSFALPDIQLAAGNYWLTLTNAQVLLGNAFIAWGVSDPNSLEAYWDGSGGKPIESFQILGDAAAPSPVPEPSSAMLVAVGIGVVGFAKCRRRGDR